VKFSLFLAPQIPPGADLETRRRLAPIGRNTEHYQKMLDELRAIAGLALVGTPDAMGRRTDALLAQAPTERFAVQLGGLQGVAPLGQVLDQLERISKHILPEYRS
jgi:hypothetical protein